MSENGATDTSAEGDVRTRLLLAAGPVFAAQGYDRATVRDICAAAQVNLASVAYYFGDKMGLYREVIQAIRDARERQFPAPHFSDGLDPRVILYRLVNTMLSRMLAADSSGWESQLLMREMQHPTPVFESLVKEFFRPLFITLTDTLGKLVGDDAPSHTVDQLALSVVGQCVYYRFGAGVVQILIPETDRTAYYDIASLSHHITAVTLAATENASLLKQHKNLDHCLSAFETSNKSTSNSSS